MTNHRTHRRAPRPLILAAALAAGPVLADTPPAAWQLAQPLASTELASPVATHGQRLALPATPPDAEVLFLPLPQGGVRVQRSWVEPREHGLSWFGHLEGDRDHTVTLTWHRGHLAGTIHLAGETWEIIPHEAGSADLVAIDQDRFPECAGEPHPAADGAVAGAPEGPAGVLPNYRDDANDIDVLIFYTAAAQAGAGGAAQIQTTAQGAVDNSNLAFAQSNLPQRFRLSAAVELTFTESGNASTDLGNFRNNPTVNALREATLADLSGLLVENGGGGCGIGYLPSSITAGSAGSAFQVTARSCAVGNLTYAHEHGHNMGMAHNPENGSGAASPFAFGHWDTSGATPEERFRTVLSYSNPCVGGCTRRPYFSSPEISYMGRPTGVPDARDNARHLRLVSDTVANFRIKTILRHGFD